MNIFNFTDDYERALCVESCVYARAGTAKKRLIGKCLSTGRCWWKTFRHPWRRTPAAAAMTLVQWRRMILDDQCMFCS